jgi:type 1 glutamine amidotransferase
MLAYSKTASFRHAEAITTGREMLNAIAADQGFEVKFTETNEEITVEGLSQYEIVFFLNSTGDIFSQQEQAAYEEWMTMHDGAFAGVHSATDTENGWGFYSEVTGQYYNGHSASPDTQGEIQWDAAQLNHVTVKGLPSPWQRQEEWYKFNQSQEWTAKPGFVVLSRVALNDDGGTRPVSYIREWGNFRSFYTSLGHAGRTFQDQDVRKHVAAGIMWAVRREAEIK